MRIAYLDCFSGISGDMMLGALVGAGVDPELFRRTVAALGVEAEIAVRQVDRSGIHCTKIDVVTAAGEQDDAHVVLAAREHSRDHSHEQGHSHDHEHGHKHGHEHSHEHHHGRSLTEITALISKTPLEDSARTLALRAFRLLGEAEAKIHNVPVEKIHFHEVGAVDAIVDIVCAAAGCVSLGVDRWISSPVNVGGGSVKCAHGVFPVPAPATAELLIGARTYSSGVQSELVTPTGAALLRALDVEFAALPEMAAGRIGYGAGSRDPKGYANVLRLTIGESDGAQPGEDVVTVIETAVDDLTPEIIGYVIEQALAAGALDVMAAPVQMKKNRPGHLITVLCHPQDAPRMADLLLQESSALGVRMRQERRRIMERRFENVSTPWGDVRVKLGFWNGKLANCAPEFEDCRLLAQQHGVPLKLVMQEATAAAANLKTQAARRTK